MLQLGTGDSVTDGRLGALHGVVKVPADLLDKLLLARTPHPQRIALGRYIARYTDHRPLHCLVFVGPQLIIFPTFNLQSWSNRL